MARRDVSDARKGAFYLGSGLMAVGLALFISVFFSHMSAFGDPSAGFGYFARAPIGMVLMVVGQLIRRVGSRGLAGAGVVLDPQRARRDLEPHARMGGGMVADALDEAGVDLGRPKRGDGWGELPLDERLRRLHALHVDGILSDKEYEREKRELLDANG